jgi:hypothetical protein
MLLVRSKAVDYCDESKVCGVKRGDPVEPCDSGFGTLFGGELQKVLKLVIGKQSELFSTKKPIFCMPKYRMLVKRRDKGPY